MQNVEINIDTILSYHIDNFLHCYNEPLLKTTKLTLRENEDVMKNLNLNFIKMT